MGFLSNYLCYDVGVNSWVIIFFNSSERYCSKQYNSIFYKLKMKNTKKQGKHLGVLFFSTFFDTVPNANLLLFNNTKLMERVRIYVKKE